MTRTRGAHRSTSRRRAVEELLDLSTRRRVCVVIGAAGWGKTRTVSAWASGTRAAWISCSGDQRPLLDELYVGLRAHVPAGGPTPPTGPREPGGSDARELCGWLREHLRDDLVLVLDDLQELAHDGAEARLLAQLVHSAPEQLHLVLISRRDPPFSLGRLRGQGFVAEVSAPQLALDVTEVGDLMEGSLGTVPAELAERVWDCTGGWPVAVTAAVELLRDTEADLVPRALDDLTRPGERLHDYLAEEVVGRESAQSREVLLRLAICGAAGSVTGLDDQSILADLARRGLVRRTGGESAGWSLVPPLRNYFQHETVLPPHDRATLHLSAAKECLGRGAPGEALRHLMAAGEHAECATLLRNHGSALVAGGQLAAVLEAAELPDEYLDDPDLQRIIGEARQVAGQSAAAQQCFWRAGKDRETLDVGLAWRMAQSAFMQGELHEVRALHRRTGLGAEDTAEAVRMLALIALTWRLVGDLISFRDATARAVAAARRCPDPRVWADVHIVLAVQASADADHRRADAHWTTAADIAGTADDLTISAFVRTGRAAHLLWFGMPRRALDEVQAALELSERCGNAFFTGHALTTRGRAHARLGALDRGVADLTSAVEIFQGMGSRFLAWPLCGLGDVHRIRGQLARARASYQEALVLAEPCHEVLGLGMALIGLARVHAGTDPAAARAFADRAVALREGLLDVPALLGQGWVALRAGDRREAASSAAHAGSVAGLRRDEPGLAEALMLGALAAERPGGDSALIEQAIDIWRESDCLLEEAAGRVVAARVRAPIADLDAELALRVLRHRRIDVDGAMAGPLGPLELPGLAVAIHTLGAFTVTREGEPVPTSAWKSRKARDLLRLLVARRRPVPREQLIEFLWPGTAAARSGNRLSVLLTMVRDVLQPERNGDGPLAGDGASVWLDRRYVAIDVEEFLDRARRALEAHNHDAGDALDRLTVAEAAYTGGFLEDDPYQEWAQALAEEVRATHIALLRALLRRLREAGEVDGAVHYALRLLEHDAYDEGTHLDLIAVHLETGHFGEARRRYRLYAKRMKEMRVVPQPMPGERRWRADYSHRQR